MAINLPVVFPASLLVISVLGQVVVSQTCTPTKGPYVGPKRPKIPDQFSMDVSYQRVVSDDNVPKMESFELQRIFFDLNRKLVAGKNDVKDGPYYVTRHRHHSFIRSIFRPKQHD